MAIHVETSLPLRPVSVEAYFRMGELGLIDDDERVELLRGAIVEMSPPSPEHDDAIEWFNMRLVPVAASAGLSVRVQSAIVFDVQDSVPMPDLMILDPRPRGRHPTTGHIAIEVSVSSLRIDTRLKAALYAEVGIPEYWVIDVRGRRVLRHSKPDGTRYTLIETLEPGEQLNSHLPTLPAIDVGELLDGDVSG